MLLARMAEAVYWAGRYLERAEDTARIVQVHGETHIDLPVGEDVGLGPAGRDRRARWPPSRNATAKPSAWSPPAADLASERSKRGSWPMS